MSWILREAAREGPVTFHFSIVAFAVYLISLIRCKKCKGEKVVSEKGRQEIFIEKGMTAGQRIVLAGAGDQEVSNHLTSLTRHS